MATDILLLMFIGSLILNLVLMISLVILGSLLKNESDEACKYRNKYYEVSDEASKIRLEEWLKRIKEKR